MSGDEEFTRDPLVRATGEVIRAHREAAGLSRPELAQALGCTPQWIEALEAGRKPLSEPTADDFDTFFKTPGRLFGKLASEIKKEGKHRAQLPGFDGYLEREAEASAIDSFESQLVPGLLQTEEYTRGLLDSGQPIADPIAMIAQRKDRQIIFDRENPPRAWFVLDESVLHRPFGGRKAMRDQLSHLIEVASAPNIQVRVLPYTSATWAAIDGSFVLLGMPDGTQVAYFETPDVGNLVSTPSRVAAAALRFSLVMGEALPASASRKMIEQVREDYT
jgi:transcriptional regulator with XRE-family HTH domain